MVLSTDDALAKALADPEELERHGADAELGVFLRRLGAFATPLREEVTFHDWNGAVVGHGGGAIVREGIPPDPSLTYPEFSHVIGMGSDARVLVAMHPSTPEDVIAKLANDNDIRVLCAVAKNARANAETIRVLIANGNPSAIVAIAARTDLDDATLAALARDVSGVTSLALRKDLSPAFLATLVAQPQAHHGLTSNPSTPAEVLRAIARPGLHFSIRSAFAKNPNTPDDVLLMLLAEPPNESLSEAIVARPRLSLALMRALAHDKDAGVRRVIAKTCTDEGILELLIEDETVFLRRLLAENPHFHNLSDLASDTKYEVRRAVAARADAPPDVLAALALDPVESVAAAARRRR